MKIELHNLERLGYGKKEAFNALKTNLSFCGTNIKVIAFTSCTPDEGKSSTVLELGRTLADVGKRVLVIDADLRKSVMVGRYRAKAEDHAGIVGLSHYLSGQNELQDIICETNVDNLDIVFAGRTSPNPTELLSSPLFGELIRHGRDNYDIILIDTPPLGAVIDTVVISKQVDGAILVVEANKCSYRFIQDIKKQLEVAEIKILGVVLNKVSVETKGGYYKKYKGAYSGYYSSYYDSGSGKKRK